jgi:hypothetical protein
MNNVVWPQIMGYGLNNPDETLFNLKEEGEHPQGQGWNRFSLTPKIGHFTPLNGFNDGRVSVDFLRLDGAGEPTFWRFTTRRPRYADEADTLDQVDDVRLNLARQEMPETIRIFFVTMAEAWELIDAGCTHIIVVQYPPYSFIYCPTLEAAEKVMALLPEACPTYGGEDPNRPGFQVSLPQDKVLAALQPLMS